jgi:hypothetical protein
MNDANPVVPKSGNVGRAVFNAIVAIVRNRTGWNFQKVFNNVLAENADLMRESLDATNHTQPLLRLFNRTQSATGLSAVASTELAAEKVAKLTNRFFPSLNRVPTALQWDVLLRAAFQLEKCDIPQRLFNRTGDPEVSKADWKTANDRAEDVFSLLNAGATQPLDRGLMLMRQLPPKQMGTAFRSAIRMLMEDDKKLTLRQAFDRLKETEPIFWTHAMLSFEPEKQ